MSEPMQPHKEGGLKEPPQTTPAPDQGHIGEGGDRQDALYDKDRVGGAFTEGEENGDDDGA